MCNSSAISQIRGFGRIERCECGSVFVNVRGVTLHLTEEAFMMLASMVSSASTKIMNRQLNQMLKEESPE